MPFCGEKKNDLSYVIGMWLMNSKIRQGKCVMTRIRKKSLCNPHWARSWCGHLQGDLVFILFLLIMYWTGSRHAKEYGTKAWPFPIAEPVLRAANNHQTGLPVEKCASSHMPEGSISLSGSNMIQQVGRVGSLLAGESGLCTSPPNSVQLWPKGSLESAGLWVFAPRKSKTLKVRASILEIQLIIECLPEGPEDAHQTLSSVLL